MNYKRLLVLIGLISFSTHCAERNNTSTEEIKANLGDNKEAFSEVATPIVLATSNSLAEDSVLFGSVRSMHIDTNNFIYILDNVSNSVLTLNSFGELHSVITLLNGRGPGEVSRPNSLFIDSEKNIYLTDRDQRKFIVMDSSGKFLYEKNIKFMPSKLIARNINEVFLTGFRFTLSGTELVKMFRLQNGEYVESGSFGTKPTNAEPQRLIDMSGFSDTINLIHSNIVISKFYPYEIEILNQDFESEKLISREVDGFIPPYMDKGLIKMDGITRELLELKDFILFRYSVNDQTFFDRYSKDFDYIETIREDSLGINPGGKYYASNAIENSVYVAYEEIEFRLVKYAF